MVQKKLVHKYACMRFSSIVDMIYLRRFQPGVRDKQLLKFCREKRKKKIYNDNKSVYQAGRSPACKKPVSILYMKMDYLQIILFFICGLRYHFKRNVNSSVNTVRTYYRKIPGT